MTAQLVEASAGKRGKDVRSDCFVELLLNNPGTVLINLKSKVKTLYGESIISLIKDMSTYFELDNITINVEDFGALPFVLAARFECAVKRLFPEIKKEYILPFNKKNLYSSTKDKLRRSRLYLPGNEPKFYINSGLHSPDGVILDLEDTVAHSEKDAAHF